MSDPQIRDATIDDMPRIVEIYNATIPGRMATADTEPVTVAERAPWFHEHDPRTRPLWVLEVRNEIVGWGSLSDFYGRPAYAKTAELSIYVDREHQGHGYGKLLLRRLIEFCPQFGVEILLGFVFAHNTPSLKMQQAFGFKQWGYLPEVAELDGQKRDLIIVGLKVSDNRGET